MEMIPNLQDLLLRGTSLAFRDPLNEELGMIVHFS